MSYTPVGPFVDGQVPALDAANLNHIEAGILGAVQASDAMIPPEMLELFAERGTHLMVTGDTAPTGQAYTVTGSLAGALYSCQVPSSGQILALGTIPGVTGAWYLIAPLAGLTGISGGCKFRLRSGGTTSGSGVALGLFNTTAPSVSPGNGVNASIHISVTTTAFQVSKLVNGTFTGMTPIGHNVYALPHVKTPLLADSSTVYDMKYIIDPVNGKAAVKAPDGSIYCYSDTALKQPCRYAFCESTIAATTDSVGEVMSWYADSSRVIAL